MIDNKLLKTKLRKELQELKLDVEKEEILVGELNYLANLLIDIYINKSKGGEK